MRTTSKATLQARSLLTGMALALVQGLLAQKPVDAPPNMPPTVEWNAGQGRLSLRYHGGVILEATVRAQDASGSPVAGAEVKLEPKESTGEKVEQRLKFTLRSPRKA